MLDSHHTPDEVTWIMGASLRDRVLMLRTEPVPVSALRVSPDLR